MKRKMIAVLGVVTVAVLLFAACAPQGTTDNITADMQAGGSAFGEFKTKDLAGNEVTQDIFSGQKLTMVNMWATYCSPCLDEMPDLAEISKEYADQGLQVVGIVTDAVDRNGAEVSAQVDIAKEIVDVTGADYTQLLPSEMIILKKLKDVTVVPTTVFVNEKGEQVGESVLGARSKEKWITIIDKVLAQESEA